MSFTNERYEVKQKISLCSRLSNTKDGPLSHKLCQLSPNKVKDNFRKFGATAAQTKRFELYEACWQNLHFLRLFRLKFTKQ